MNGEGEDVAEVTNILTEKTAGFGPNPHSGREPGSYFGLFSSAFITDCVCLANSAVQIYDFAALK